MPSSLSASDSSSGKRHPVERGLRADRAAAPPCRRACSASSAISAIGRLRAADARELLADQPMLLAAARRARRRRPRRSPARRAAAACARSAPCRRRRRRSRRRAGQADDLEQADELVDAGNRQIEQRVDVLAIEPGAVLEDVAERAPVVAQPARERARRVELDGVQAPRPRRRGRARAATTAATPSASPSECAGSVETSSTRRPGRALRRPPSAAAHVVLPTPPLPPKKMKRRSEGGSSASVLDSFRRRRR